MSIVVLCLGVWLRAALGPILAPDGPPARSGGALPVWSDLTLNFQSEFAFRCKLWPARLVGDEHGSDRGLRS